VSAPEDEPETTALEEEFPSWLAACDEQLAAGATVASLDEVGAPQEVRPRLEREAAWCRWVRRAWPHVSGSTLAPIGTTPGAGPPSSQPLPEGLGRFLIRDELGRGAFGVVYLAYDPRLRREVALKVPQAEALLTSELRARFRNEAMAAAGLDHPNIVPVYEAGEEGSAATSPRHIVRGSRWRPGCGGAPSRFPSAWRPGSRPRWPRRSSMRTGAGSCTAT